MTKSQFRTKYRNLRSNLTSDEIASLSIEIANKSLELPIWDFQYYHLFLPITTNNEVDTSYLLSILQGRDKNVIVPKANFETNSLQHILLTDSTRLVISNYGIPEPEEGITIRAEDLQLIFIPLLAFDLKGNRIGYGKGFYDRFLSTCKPDSVKVGLSYFEAESQIEEVNKFDVKLDYCITPQTIYEFA